MTPWLYKPLLIASITTSSILFGCQLSLSYVSIATIISTREAPEALLLSQWRTVFLRGFRLCPPLAISSGLCHFANAFLTYGIFADPPNFAPKGRRVISLLAAGVFAIGIVPYTLLMIVPLENVLIAKEAKFRQASTSITELGDGVDFSIKDMGNDKSTAETRGLLEKWSLLNYGRTVLPLLGTFIGWSSW